MEKNKILTPFKLCVLQNFPYIEQDFDALTNYELMCKIVEYLNKTIEQQNITSENINKFYDWFNDLDVSEEINNKLDKMAEDGTLTNLIKNYVDPIYSAYEERINNIVDVIQDEVSSVTSGSPAGVYNTIAELQQADPDHSKIYVVLEDGEWYFWNNTTMQWKNGGVYLATPDVIQVSTHLIKSDTYEYYLPDLNGALSTMTYNLLFTAGATDKPLNLPVEPSGRIETLIVIKTDNVIKQIYVAYKNVFTRYKYGSGNFQSWQTVDNNATGNVTVSNYSTVLPDLNNITYTSKYSILIAPTTAEGSKPANLPDITTGQVETLITEQFGNTLTQTYITPDNIYYRYKQSGNWSTWKKITTTNRDLIVAGNYETLLPDLNTISNDGIYGLLFASTGGRPANMPEVPSGKVDTLFNYVLNNNRGMQIYYTDNDTYYRWKYGNTWREWKSVSNQVINKINIPKIIYCGANEQFTTLKSAVEYSNNYDNVTIYVKAGTYDLYQEFGGDEFFNNYNSGITHGLVLKNNVHLIFSSDSKVVFNNTSTNNDVARYFSPFNAGVKGFTLENCTIESSKCRYCVHDERQSNTDLYVNKYINCNFYNDSRNGGFTACIGGGLGTNGEIEIENCYFENPGCSNSYQIVSYHNSASSDAKSNIRINNCYCKNGTIKMLHYGDSTKITKCIITNNRVKSTVVVEPADETSLIENMQLLQFNNVIE